MRPSRILITGLVVAVVVMAFTRPGSAQVTGWEYRVAVCRLSTCTLTPYLSNECMLGPNSPW